MKTNKLWGIFFMFVMVMSTVSALTSCSGDDDENVPDGNSGKLPSGVKAVDLGLSVKWASCNVGATSSEKYGDYFAWGETEPKTEYNWSNYTLCNGSEETITKYRSGTSEDADNKTVLDPEDDAAHVNWGGAWRMPTMEEWEELRTKCSWTRDSQNGVSGYLVKSPNGNSIFLPAAGYNLGINRVNCGHYWTSSLRDNEDAYSLDFEGKVRIDYGSRRYGQSIRPVCQ